MQTEWFYVFGNRAVSENDLWTDGIYWIKSDNRVIASNLINSLNFLVEFMISYI